MRPKATAFGLLQLLLGERRFFEWLETSGTQIYSCVTDTNILVNEARAAAVKMTPLNQAAAIGTINLFATTAVRDEVPRVIVDMAQGMRFAAGPVLQAWHTSVAPWITFVETAGLPDVSAESRRLVQEYERDAPTARLVDLLNPDLFLTLDSRHFAAFHIVPSPAVSLPHFKVAVRDRSIGDALHLGVGVGGSIVIVGGIAVVSRLVSALLNALKGSRLSGLAVAVAATFGGLWYVHRRYIGGNQQQPVVASASDLRARIRKVLTMLGDQIVAGAAAQSALATVLRHSEAPHEGKQYVARVLAHAAFPCRLSYIVQQMMKDGYKPRRLPPRQSVQRLLRSQRRLFTQSYEGRWAVRSYPPAASADSSGPVTTGEYEGA